MATEPISTRYWAARLDQAAVDESRLSTCGQGGSRFWLVWMS
jgi:hypothetical protein